MTLVAGLALVPATGGSAARRGWRTDDLNVVFVILDAARASDFGAYGAARDTTPNIDAFARESTLFERAYAQSAWTLPSSASFMTGTYPPRRTTERSHVSTTTIATLLQDVGYATAGFSENPYVTGEFGFTRGFTSFREYEPWESYKRVENSYAHPDTVRSIDDVVAWIKAASGQGRFFAYVHLLRPHCPYDPPPPFSGRFDQGYSGKLDGSVETLRKINRGALVATDRDLTHLRDLYDENLAFGDREVGRLLAPLRSLELDDRTIVIIAADHGEAFREHGRMLHTTTVYEEMVHVPLVIHFPRRFGDLPRRWSGVVELRSLLPTIRDALGLEPAANDAPSLLRVVRGNASEGVALIRTIDASRRPLAAVVGERYKLIQGSRIGSTSLYDLDDDPGEKHDVSGSNRPLVLRMRALLRSAEADAPPADGAGARQVRPETQQKLRALGYAD